MTRPLALLIAATILSAAPLAARAQAWPATGAAAAPGLAEREDASALAMARVASWSRLYKATAQGDRRVLLRTSVDADDLQDSPQVNLRPKAEWIDDEGLRIGLAKLAYKQRF